MTNWIVAAYGVFILLVGIVGDTKAKRTTSMVAGSLFGLLLLVCAIAISKYQNQAAISNRSISYVKSFSHPFRDEGLVINWKNQTNRLF